MSTAENDRATSPERIPAFVDAVFAIIITILVLEIEPESAIAQEAA